MVYLRLIKFMTCPTGKYQSVKNVQILSYFWSVFSRIWTEDGPEITPYLDTFHAVYLFKIGNKSN